MSIAAQAAQSRSFTGLIGVSNEGNSEDVRGFGAELKHPSDLQRCSRCIKKDGACWLSAHGASFGSGNRWRSTMSPWSHPKTARYTPRLPRRDPGQNSFQSTPWKMGTWMQSLREDEPQTTFVFFFGQPARAGINDPENGTYGIVYINMNRSYGIVYINMNRSASIGRSNFGAWPVCLLVLKSVSPLDCLGPASAGLF